MNETTLSTGATPVSLTERIHALDTTRGFAVLGILIMNIWSFAGPQSFYDNPTIVADWGGAALQTWSVMHTFFEGSQRALFSLLFGAGMLLMVNRLDERAAGISSARLYYRRLFFLFLFGLFDLFVLLWPADILFVYALCGVVLYPFRRCRPMTLVLLALVVFAAQAGLRTLSWQETVALQQEFGNVAVEQTVIDADASEANSSDEDEAMAKRRADWEAIQNRAHPQLDSPEMQEDIRIYSSGTLSEFLPKKLIGSLVLMIVVGLKSMLLDSLGAMLIGMALLRSGVLYMQATTRTYVIMTAVAYGVGLPLALWETSAIIASDFDAVLKARNLIHYDLRRMAMGLGHLGAILLFCRLWGSGWLAMRLAAVGRMALSNYLGQSVICGLIFYTVGFGLYGQFTGYYLYMVVLGVWIVQIAFSNWWLSRYRFGPAEWVWKSLTYKQRQPLAK